MVQWQCMAAFMETVNKCFLRHYSCAGHTCSKLIHVLLTCYVFILLLIFCYSLSLYLNLFIYYINSLAVLFSWRFRVGALKKTVIAWRESVALAGVANAQTGVANSWRLETDWPGCWTYWKITILPATLSETIKLRAHFCLLTPQKSLYIGEKKGRRKKKCLFFSFQTLSVIISVKHWGFHVSIK